MKFWAALTISSLTWIILAIMGMYAMVTIFGWWITLGSYAVGGLSSGLLWKVGTSE